MHELRIAHMHLEVDFQKLICTQGFPLILDHFGRTFAADSTIQPFSYRDISFFHQAPIRRQKQKSEDNRKQYSKMYL